MKTPKNNADMIKLMGSGLFVLCGFYAWKATGYTYLMDNKDPIWILSKIYELPLMLAVACGIGRREKWAVMLLFAWAGIRLVLFVAFIGCAVFLPDSSLYEWIGTWNMTYVGVLIPIVFAGIFMEAWIRRGDPYALWTAKCTSAQVCKKADNSHSS